MWGGERKTKGALKVAPPMFVDRLLPEGFCWLPRVRRSGATGRRASQETLLHAKKFWKAKEFLVSLIGEPS